MLCQIFRCSSLAPLLTLCRGETGQITATVTDPQGQPVAPGTEVIWFTNNGMVNPRSSLTDASGVATTTLDATGGRATQVLPWFDKPGTVVSATVSNFSKGMRIPFVGSSGYTYLAIEHPVVIGGITTGGTDTYDWWNQVTGQVEQRTFPYYAETLVPVIGEPNQRVSPRTFAVEEESVYPLDTATGGQSPDSNGGLPLVLEYDAHISSDAAIRGVGSLHLDGVEDRALVADTPVVDFESGVRVRAWLRPSNTGPSSIADKDGELALAVQADGTVTFSVETDAGPHVIQSTTALIPDVWQYLEAEYVDGRLRLVLDQAIETVPASGGLVGGTAPLVVGEGYAGYIDQFVVGNVGAGTNLITLSGVDVDGWVQLDGDGYGSFIVHSAGTQTTDLERILLKVTPEVAVGMKGAAEECDFKEVYLVRALEVWRAAYAFGAGFVAGQQAHGGGDDWAVMAGDVAAGVFIWGDLRDCAIQTVLAVRPDREADWPTFGFAAAGLLAEFAPGLGEPFDAVLGYVKAIIKKIPDQPFRSLIADVPVRLVKMARSSGKWETALEYCVGMERFLGYVTGNEITDVVRKKWFDLMSSERRLDGLGRAFRVSCPVGKTNTLSDPCIDVLYEIIDGNTSEVCEKFAKVVFDKFDDAEMLEFLQNREAAQGLAKLFDQFDTSSEAIARLHGLTLPFPAGGNYLLTETLVDVNRLIDRNALGSGYYTLDLMSRGVVGETNPGKLYEIYAHARLPEDLVPLGIVSKEGPFGFLDSLGIDGLAASAGGEIGINCKTTANALLDYFGHDISTFKKRLDLKIKAVQDTGRGYAFQLPASEIGLLPPDFKKAITDQARLIETADVPGIDWSIGYLPPNPKVE